jgi:crotonobetainyl-CoA:carnitine CoA-transferase CaiB-like acyl-CoA transferase
MRPDFRSFANPIKLDGERLPAKVGSGLGADTDDVLRELGYTARRNSTHCAPRRPSEHEHPDMKLQGLRVIDLSLFLPGPHLTLMMADHGAEVIKVEPPGDGEPNRHMGAKEGEFSVYFRNTHRGKKSVSVNLKDAAEREALLKLCETADVFIEAFRPGRRGPARCRLCRRRGAQPAHRLLLDRCVRPERTAAGSARA